MCFQGAPLVMAAVNAASQLASSSAQAKAAGNAARRAQDEAALAAESERDRAVRLRAALRTGYARAGVATEGSPSEALSDRAFDDEKRAQTLLWRGKVAADEQRGQASLIRAQGALGAFNGLGNALYRMKDSRA